MQRIQDQPGNTVSASPKALTARAAAAKLPRILMVGAHPTRTLGGISAVINELLRSPIAEEFALRHLASQIDEYRRFGKLVLALTAFVRFGLTLFWWRPQLVYVHVGSNASLYRKAAFITLARWARHTVLTHFHAGDFDHYYARQNQWGRWFIRAGLKHSTRLIAVSNALAERLRELLPHADLTMIPNGIETAAFAPSARPQDGYVRLLFVGAMGKLKGERDLLAAVQRIAVRLPNLRLLLLGHGAETIKELCRQYKLEPLIEHLGPVAHHARHRFFRRADFFVLPSYGEGMPIAVLEAMAAGLPVIATRVGGIPELIENGVHGLLVEPGAITALSTRIECLASDQQLRDQMGRRSREKSCQFDQQIMVTQLRQEIRRLLQ